MIEVFYIAYLKKDLLKKALPIPEDVYHDRWLAFFAARENKLKVLTQSLILYRRHGKNVSKKQTFFNKLNVFLDNKKFLKNLITKDDDKKARQCFELINSIERFNFTKKDFDDVEEDDDFIIEKSHTGIKVFFLILGFILLAVAMYLIITKYVL